jgi:hypothetical protein
MTTRRDFLRLAGGVTGAVVLSSCTREEKAAGDRVFVDTDRGLAVVDVGRREPVLAAVPAVAGAGWRLLYATRPDGRRTRLVTLDPATGRETARTALAGGLGARAVSASGRLVALADRLPSGRGTYRPPARTRTTIVVADPAGKQAPRRIELPGNYEPEAFSTDDQRMYVLQYLPAEAPERYRVRAYDLTAGEVGPLSIRDKGLVPVAAEEEMRGEGRQAVLAPDRSRLYTLYTHQPDHLHTRDLLAADHNAGKPEVHAFVHVLSLTEGWAFCLDLPAPFGHGAAAAHALAVAPDGRRLYVADRTSGQVVAADTERLAIVAKARFAAAPGAAAAQLSPDGRLLYVGSDRSVAVLDSAGLGTVRTLTLDAAVLGFGVGPDGGVLHVGHRGRLASYDAQTGRRTSQADVPGLVSVRHVA